MTPTKQENGLISKIWGNPGWTFATAVAFGYPQHPTKEQRENYQLFFENLGNVLPCGYCRDSYHETIHRDPTRLSADVMRNRDTLTRWLYDVHSDINRKLGMDYATSYQDMVNLYESFRANCQRKTAESRECVVSDKYKAAAYQKLYYQNAAVIPLALAQKFVALARKRGLNDNYFLFIKLAEALDGDISKIKSQDCWLYRNKLCQGIIRKMRIHAITCLETEGEYQDLPTIPELILIMFMCSNMNQFVLTDIAKKIEPLKFDIKSLAD